MAVDVLMGELKVSNSSERLEARGVGSCIIVMLFDPVIRIGGLAHSMMPSIDGAPPTSEPFKFADRAIDEMLGRMEELGSLREDIEAKIVGGGNMFPSIKFNPELQIGNSNIEVVKEKLEKEGIKLAGEDVGGHTGRSIVFDTSSGVVTIKKVI